MGYQDDKVMERGEERECSYRVPVVVSICPDLWGHLSLVLPV